MQNGNNYSLKRIFFWLSQGDYTGICHHVQAEIWPCSVRPGGLIETVGPCWSLPGRLFGPAGCTDGESESKDCHAVEQNQKTATRSFLQLCLQIPNGSPGSCAVPVRCTDGLCTHKNQIGCFCGVTSLGTSAEELGNPRYGAGPFSPSPGSSSHPWTGQTIGPGEGELSGKPQIRGGFWYWWGGACLFSPVHSSTRLTWLLRSKKHIQGLNVASCVSLPPRPPAIENLCVILTLL